MKVHHDGKCPQCGAKAIFENEDGNKECGWCGYEQRRKQTKVKKDKQ